MPRVCITSKDATAADIKEMKKVCPTFKGKDTITSLINAGMKKGHKAWNFFIMEGAFMRRGLLNRFSLFMEDEKDILFPIVMDHDIQGKPIKLYTNFYDCSINGILIHQKMFKKVGDLSENPLEISRLWWTMDAIDKGAKFKAVLGTKIC